MSTTTNGNGHSGKPDKTVKRRLPEAMKATMFKKGNCANPNGRPRRAETLGHQIRAFADRLDPKDKLRRTRLEVLIERLYHEDPKTWLAYGFGKPVEMLEIAGAEGQPVEFRIAVKGSQLPA